MLCGALLPKCCSSSSANDVVQDTNEDLIMREETNMRPDSPYDEDIDDMMDRRRRRRPMSPSLSPACASSSADKYDHPAASSSSAAANNNNVNIVTDTENDNDDKSTSTSSSEEDTVDYSLEFRLAMESGSSSNSSPKRTTSSIGGMSKSPIRKKTIVVSAFKPQSNSRVGLIFTRSPSPSSSSSNNNNNNKSVSTIIARVTSDSIFQQHNNTNSNKLMTSLNGATLLSVNDNPVHSPRHAAELVANTVGEVRLQLVVAQQVQQQSHHKNKSSPKKNNNNKTMDKAEKEIELQLLKHEQRMLKAKIARTKQKKTGQYVNMNENDCCNDESSKSTGLNNHVLSEIVNEEHCSIDPEILTYDSDSSSKNDDDDEEDGVVNTKKNKGEEGGGGGSSSTLANSNNNDAQSTADWSQADVIESAFGKNKKKKASSTAATTKKKKKKNVNNSSKHRRAVSSPVGLELMKQISSSEEVNFSSPVASSDTDSADGATSLPREEEKGEGRGSVNSLLLQNDITTDVVDSSKKTKVDDDAPSKDGKCFITTTAKDDDDISSPNGEVVDDAQVGDILPTTTSSSDDKKKKKRESKNKKPSKMSIKRAFGLKSSSSAKNTTNIDVKVAEVVAESAASPATVHDERGATAKTPPTPSAVDIINDLNLNSSQSNDGDADGAASSESSSDANKNEATKGKTHYIVIDELNDDEKQDISAVLPPPPSSKFSAVEWFTENILTSLSYGMDSVENDKEDEVFEEPPTTKSLDGEKSDEEGETAVEDSAQENNKHGDAAAVAEQQNDMPEEEGFVVTSTTGSTQQAKKRSFFKRAFQKSKPSSEEVKTISEVNNNDTRVPKKKESESDLDLTFDSVAKNMEDAVNNNEIRGRPTVSKETEEVGARDNIVATDTMSTIKTTPVKKKKKGILKRAFKKSKDDNEVLIAKDQDEASAAVAKKEDSTAKGHEEDLTAIDLDVTPTGDIEVQTPSKKGLFNCSLSPISAKTPPPPSDDKLEDGIDVTRTASNNDATTASCSMSSNDMPFDITPPTVRFGLPKTPPTPTKNGESWNVSSFLFGITDPPSPSASIIGATPVAASTPISDEERMSPSSSPREDLDEPLIVECRLNSSGKMSVNISMERIVTDSDDEHPKEDRSQLQPPPPVNRKLEQSFNDSLCVDPFQSRADITTVYIDDREYDEDVIDFARAKKNAFDIVRRSRSNLFMKGPLKGGLSSSSEVKRAQHYVDNTLATVDITNDASMMS